MAALLEMQGVAFKPRAYEKAALGVESLDREAVEIYKEGGFKALEEIPSVGKGIAGHIEEMIKTDSFKEYRQLKKRTPVDISGLLAVEGIGPQKVLYGAFGALPLWSLDNTHDLGIPQYIQFFT